MGEPVPTSPCGGGGSAPSPPGDTSAFPLQLVLPGAKTRHRGAGQRGLKWPLRAHRADISQLLLQDRPVH